MAISNRIFEHYRKHKKDIDEAKMLLKKNGFVVYERKKKTNGKR
tara:strand:- start:1095 stop:1226 length:132 start_codon:yes stop_codon:yes gene_type:complete